MKKYYIISLLLVTTALGISIFQYCQTFKNEIAEAYQATKPINGHSWGEMQCTGDMCVDTVNHRVGIGTDSPNNALDVVGNIASSGDVCNGTGKCLSSVYEIISFAGTNPTCPTGKTLLMKGYNGTWYMGTNASITSWTQALCGTLSTLDGTPLLANGLHTEKNCTDLTANGGTVVSDGSGNSMCRLNLASCPSGWTQYNNWTTTTGGAVAPASPAAFCGCSIPSYSGATTTGHTWQNKALESARNCGNSQYDTGWSYCGANSGYNMSAGGYSCTSWNCLSGTNACGGMNSCGAYVYSTVTQIGCY